MIVYKMAVLVSYGQKIIASWNMTSLLVGMNLIDDSGDFVRDFSRGHVIIQPLRRACLLEDGDELHTPNVKMHDIKREMT